MYNILITYDRLISFSNLITKSIFTRDNNLFSMAWISIFLLSTLSICGQSSNNRINWFHGTKNGVRIRTNVFRVIRYRRFISKLFDCKYLFYKNIRNSNFIFIKCPKIFNVQNNHIRCTTIANCSSYYPRICISEKKVWIKFVENLRPLKWFPVGTR